MRRITAGFIAFIVLTATFLILPVYAAPTPEAVPVETSAEEIAMGSVEAPAAEAEVQEGLTEPARGSRPPRRPSRSRSRAPSRSPWSA